MIADSVNAVQSGNTTDHLLRANANLTEQNRRLRADWLSMSAGNQELVDKVAEMQAANRELMYGLQRLQSVSPASALVSALTPSEPADA